MIYTACRETVSQVERLLVAARSADLGDRRAAERYPFFRPVTIAIEQAGYRHFSAFSRDISASGMGLLHNMPVPEGRVTLLISHHDGEEVRLSATIAWCRSCGEGWYTSGARFVEATRP